jgi:VWFA-related protein
MILRLTEYLAGPPLYEEIDLLKQDAEKWRLRVAALEVERDEAHQRAALFGLERDRLTKNASAMKKERDELKERATSLEKASHELEERAARLEKERDQLRRQLANWNEARRNAQVQLPALESKTELTSLSESGDVGGHGSGRTDKLDLVVFNITVTKTDNQPVEGLIVDQFHVFEDDREQRIELFQPENTPSTIGLVIDNSGSMMDKRSDVVSAASAFIAASHPQDEMFIVNFNRNAWLALPASQGFTRERAQLRAALAQTRAEGTTALYDALKFAIQHLEMSTRQRRAIVVLSDGSDNSSATKFEDVLRFVQQSSATISCIGIYDPGQKDRDPVVLKAIASVTGGEAYFPDSLESLHSEWQRIAASIRGQYTIGYVSSNAARDGKYRKIQVTAVDDRGKPLRVRARPGYMLRPGAQ